MSEKLQLWLYFTHKCCLDWKQSHNRETCEQPIQYLIIPSLSFYPWLVAETHGGMVWSMHEVLTILPPSLFVYRPVYVWNIAWCLMIFLCIHACESAFRDQRTCPPLTFSLIQAPKDHQTVVFLSTRQNPDRTGSELVKMLMCSSESPWVISMCSQYSSFTGRKIVLCRFLSLQILSFEAAQKPPHLLEAVACEQH